MTKGISAPPNAAGFKLFAVGHAEPWRSKRPLAGVSKMKLTVDRLSKSYGAKEALKGVSFSLEGGIYGLLGPNGSGKSTLMKILTGNLQASSGTVLWNGENIAGLGRRYREILGYVPQQQALYPDFTAVRFLSYIAALQGLGKAEAGARIAAVLDEVALSDVMNKKIKALSGGMKQRLLIEQSILARPQLLIMDEPTAGLDPRQRASLRALISRIAADKIVLIATHVVSDVELIAKEILLLKNGELIRKSLASSLIAEVSREHGQAQVLVPTQAQALAQALAQAQAPAQAPALSFAGLGLEDVYLHFFGDQNDDLDSL
jgi:ABC-type multidrug transport system ATPase subunit